MSSVVIAGNTSGSITLQAPAVSGSTVLTLPTTSATLITDSSGILNIGSGQLYKDASGNVGIGTSSPGAILHTFKTAAAAATVGAFIQNSDTTVGTEVRLGFAANTNTLSQDRYGWIGYVNTGGTNGGALTFATTAGGTPATERMRIDSSGNVGIGTSSPSGKTHIYTTAAVGAVNQASSALNIENTPGDPVLILTGAYGGIIASMTSAQAATPMRFFTGNTERMRIDSSGNLLVGTTAQVESSKLTIYGASSVAGSGLGFAASGVTNKYVISIDSAGGLTTRKDSADFWYLGRSGSANCVSSGGSWVNSSDERLKDNIETLPNALKNVLKLRGVSFIRKTTQQQEIGVIAQEVKGVYPEVVEDSGDMLGVNYGALTGVLIEAIKELKAIIDTQQEQINSLLGK
jgi:hypothetical protein